MYGNEIYYYQNGVEVDFYIPAKHLAIQVCYNINDEETRKREVNALLKMNKQFENLELLIITKDDFEPIKIDNVEIKVVSLWKWLLTINEYKDI